MNYFYDPYMPEAKLKRNLYSIFLGELLVIRSQLFLDVDGDPMSYYWDFGDGNSYEAGEIVSYTYWDKGSYTLSLTVEDQYGNTDTDIADVFIYGVEAILPPVMSLLL